MLVQQADSFKKNIAHDGQTFRAQLVHRILHGVVVRVPWAVVEVDNVSASHAALRKGQMVVVESHGPERLNVVLRTPEIYLVPRGDGRIAIGATVEEAGFDKQVRAEATAQLLDTAAGLWPPVRTMRVVDAWAGLRPATADNLPVIDECGQRCWVAAGHFRNGILLAPGTARLLRKMICGESLSVVLEPFRCGRFTASSVHSR